jgi:hypothetical protein
MILGVSWVSAIWTSGASPLDMNQAATVNMGLRLH